MRGTGGVCGIVKELRASFQHQLQLEQLSVAPSEALSVAVELEQLRLQLLQLGVELILAELAVR